MVNENGDASKRARNTPVIGTHDGTFHCDEALAIYMLKKLPEYENAEILRTRDEALLKSQCSVVIDVGGVYNHENKLYDHHQLSFQSTFSSLRPDIKNEFNIRLSSAGLIYVHYGERIIESILLKEANKKLSKEQLQCCYLQIYRSFMSEIDAVDNGVPMYETDLKPRYTFHTTISLRVANLNPTWDKPAVTKSEMDKLFCDAMELVGGEFVAKVLNIGVSWINARDYVMKALSEAKSIHESGQILLLERFCPWKSHLFSLEVENDCVGIAKLIIFEDTNGSWRVAGVPISPESYLGRKFLPESWRGLRNDELCKVADIADLLFVHHNGFIGGAANKEAAIAMAVKAIEWL